MAIILTGHRLTGICWIGFGSGFNEAGVTGTSLVVLLTPSAREEPLLARLVMSLVGGMMLAPLVILIALPALISLCSRRKQQAPGHAASLHPAE